jgi:hypothetical protein
MTNGITLNGGANAAKKAKQARALALLILGGTMVPAALTTACKQPTNSETPAPSIPTEYDTLDEHNISITNGTGANQEAFVGKIAGAYNEISGNYYESARKSGGHALTIFLETTSGVAGGANTIHLNVNMLQDDVKNALLDKVEVLMKDYGFYANISADNNIKIENHTAVTDKDISSEIITNVTGAYNAITVTSNHTSDVFFRSELSGLDFKIVLENTIKKIHDGSGIYYLDINKLTSATIIEIRAELLTQMIRRAQNLNRLSQYNANDIAPDARNAINVAAETYAWIYGNKKLSSSISNGGTNSTTIRRIIEGTADDSNWTNTMVSNVVSEYMNAAVQKGVGTPVTPKKTDDQVRAIIFELEGYRPVSLNIDHSGGGNANDIYNELIKQGKGTSTRTTIEPQLLNSFNTLVGQWNAAAE